jgi:hypothetical protein
MKKLVFLIPFAMLAALVPLRSEALGGESLGCFVNVGSPGVYSSPTCDAPSPRFSYTVPFQVLGGSGAYSYAWNTTGLTVSSGCTASSSSCIISARGIAADQTLTVSVVITQSGQQATLSASANIAAVCNLAGMPVDC